MVKPLHFKIIMKLSILLLIVSVIPLVISTILVTAKYDNALEKAVKDEQLTLAASAAAGVERRMDMKIKAIQEMIKHNKDVLMSGSIPKIIPILKQMQYADPENVSFGYVDIKGMAYGSDGINRDLSGFIGGFFSHKDVNITDFVIQDGNKQMISIAVPILDEHGSYRGMISSNLDVNTLLKDIYAVQSGSVADAYLISEQGMYIAHRQAEKIGKLFIDYETKENIELLQRTVLTQQAGNIHYEERNGSEIIASYAAVNMTGWRVVVTAGSSDLLSAADAAKRTSYLLILLFAAAAVVIAVLVSRIILSPVLKISSLMKKVAMGDFTERLTVSTDDEIGTLKRNINSMLDSFIAAMTNLEKTMKSEQELLIKNIMMDRASKIDSLTGLYNHKSYHEYMDKMMEHQHLNEYAVLLAVLDIDNFKRVNDTYGHSIGDIALKKAAERIMEHLDPNDFAARYGGEEFVILLTSKTHEVNLQILESIRQSIQNTPIHEMGGNSVTVSMGVHIFAPGDTKEMVFNQADQALYAAKRSGKNKIVIMNGNGTPEQD